MAATSFHHGTRVFESADTPLLVKQNATAVIGLIGTAPDADTKAFPLNQPVQLLRVQDAANIGNAGTLKDALDTIYDVTNCPIIVVRIEDAADMNGLFANAIGVQTKFTGVHAFRQATSKGLYKPRMIIAPGLTQNSGAADGIASINVTVAGSGYNVDTTTVTISGTGTGATAKATIGDNGAIAEIIVTNAGYGYTGQVTATITGDGQDAVATANIGGTMNPVVSELIGVCEKLRAVAYVDGPDTTDQAAVQYRSLIASDRIIICDPKGLKFDTVEQLNVPVPSSPQFAAQQAKMDLEQGFWYCGSNVAVSGFVGVNRPVEYGTQSDYLNENRINTIVNINNSGFRLWGVWTCADDLMWQFISVRRTADFINEGLEEAYLKFVDKPFSQANLKFMLEGGRNYLRLMEREGALLPGSDIWLLDTNSDEEMVQGIIKFGVKFEPPAPMTDIRITSYRNIAAYELLLNQVAQQFSSGSL